MNDTEYEVDKILDKKLDEQGKILYKICWKGYTSDYDTWEPAENLGRCRKAIEKYENNAARDQISSKIDQFCGEFLNDENSLNAVQIKTKKCRRRRSTNAVVWQIANNLEPSEPSSSSSGSSSPAPPPSILIVDEKISPPPAPVIFSNKKRRKSSSASNFRKSKKSKIDHFSPSSSSSVDTINETIDEIFVRVVNGVYDQTPRSNVEKIGQKTPIAAEQSPSSPPAISLVQAPSIGGFGEEQSCQIVMIENPSLVENRDSQDLIAGIVDDLSILDRLGDRLRRQKSLIANNQQSPVQLAMRCLVESEPDDHHHQFCDHQEDSTFSNSQNYAEFCSDLQNLDQFLTKTLSILKRGRSSNDDREDQIFENLNLKFFRHLLNGDLDDVEQLLENCHSSNLDVNFSHDGKNALTICCSTPCSSSQQKQQHVRCNLISNLISKGCLVNFQDGVGETALSIAVRNGHVCQTEILLRNGADPNLLNNMNENALFTAVRFCPEEKIDEILNLLLIRGNADFYARNVYGQKVGAVVQETGRQNLFRLFDQYQTRLEQIFHRHFQETYNLAYVLSKNVQILQLRYHKINNKSRNFDSLCVQFKISEIWVPENFAPWLFLAVVEKNDDGLTKFSPTKNFLRVDVFLNDVRLQPVSTFIQDILWFKLSYGINKLDFRFKIETNEPITLAFQANVVRFNVL